MAAAPRSRFSLWLGWLGLALSAAALLSYFTLAVKVPDLRDSAWLNLLAVAAGVVLSTIAFARSRSVWTAAGLAVSALSAVALLGYVFVLSSRVPPAEHAIAVGTVAPDFQLPDVDGVPVALSDYAGSSVALVFYRGFW